MGGLIFHKTKNSDSRLLISIDNEFMNLLDIISVDKSHIPSILSYYESIDACFLSNEIRLIKAFQNIFAPMKESEDSYIPDLKSSYFIEDFPFGLSYTCK